MKMTIWCLNSPKESEAFQLNSFSSSTGHYHKITENYNLKNILPQDQVFVLSPWKEKEIPFSFFSFHLTSFHSWPQFYIIQITSSYLSPQNHTIHIVQFNFPKEISTVSMRYFYHQLFFLSIFFFFQGKILITKIRNIWCQIPPCNHLPCL